MLILIKISNVEEDVKTFFLIIYYNFTKKKITTKIKIKLKTNYKSTYGDSNGTQINWPRQTLNLN